MIIKLIGLDPSLSNWGLSFATYDTETDKLTIKKGFVIKTKPEKSKQSKNIQDLGRAYKLYLGLSHWINQADIWCAELPTGSQSARAMVSYGICLGILGSLINQNPNFYSYNPIAIKKQVGNNTASKDDVIAFVLDNYPEVKSWLPKAKNQAEHICDSIMTLHLLVQEPNFKETAMKIVLSQSELENLVNEEISNQGFDLSNKAVDFNFTDDGVEIEINTTEKPTQKRKRKSKQDKQEEVKETVVEVEEVEQEESEEDEDDFFADTVETSETESDALEDTDELFG